MKIISFLRTVPNEDSLKPASYLAGECEFIKNGKFLTSSDALSYANKDANFLFLGGKNEIENFKNRFTNLPKNYTCKEISTNYSDLFKEILANFDDENIILDITHASRDISFISPFAALLNSSIKPKNFTLIHAKPTANKNEFEFIRLDEYSEIMKFAFVLISFKQFIKVPFLGIQNNSLYDTLKSFSEDFVSNQIYECASNLGKFRAELQKAKNGKMSFLSEFIDEILNEWDEFFTKLSGKKEYEIYFLVAKKMHEKGYFLNASNFLIEAIPHYVFEKLKSYLNIKVFNKNMSDFCNIFISNGQPNGKYDNKEYSIKPPFDHFYILNSDIFKTLYNFRKSEIGDVRHRLTHIEKQDIGDVKEKLNNLINKFDNMILQDDILSKLDFNKEKVKDLTIYHYENFTKNLKSKINVNFSKKTIEKAIKSYFNGSLDLSILDYKKFKQYMDKNKEEVTLIYKNYENYIKNGEIYFNKGLK